MEERVEIAKKTALSIAEAGLDKKALNVEIINVFGKVDYTDFVVVMSGTSDRHVQSIAQGIEYDLKHKKGIRCAATEGISHGSWVLMDYLDVIVHVFHENTRGYYDLESLWIDAARVSTEDIVLEHKKGRDSDSDLNGSLFE